MMLRLQTLLLSVAVCLSPAWAQAPAAAGQPVVLLATYVVSPARLARLQAAALQAGVAMQMLSAQEDTPQTLAKALREARLLVIDAPHSSVTQTAAARFGEVIKKSGKPYVVVGEFSAVAKNQPIEAAPLQADSGVSTAWAQRLREYWRFGGAQNTGLAMAALQSTALPGAGVAGLAAAVQLPLAGFYNPGWPHIEADAQNLENHFFSASKRPLGQHLLGPVAIKTVAIAVNNAVFTSDDTAWLDALIAALEQRGLRAYAFYGPRQQKDLFFQATHVPTPGVPDGVRRMADIIINAALVFNPTDRKAELERIGVPVL